MLNILIIHGTTRPGNLSSRAAKYVFEEVKALPEVDVKLISPNDYPIKKDGNDPEQQYPDYTELVIWADAFIIVTPEYNHGYPGSLKQLIDKEFANYNRKAASVIGVSNGAIGGARAVEGLLPVLRAVGLFVTKTSLYFPRVQDLIDESGQISDPEIAERAKQVIEENIWLGNALKQARQQSE